MRISDWSSDVCSSDLIDRALLPASLAEVTPSVVALPAGVSSEILLRRPDVIEAEYDLRAANADIGVARARLFPLISLTGLLGFASNAQIGRASCRERVWQSV